jgi:hypothetical protein
MYYEQDEGLPQWVQVDVSSERGYWKLSRLLASADVDEVRIVGDSQTSIAVARTIVVAGQFRRNRDGRRWRLRKRGDEAYPRKEPYIFINPVPDPAAFD